MGRVSNIYLRPSARTPAREVASAKAQAGAGLDGDHARGGNRQVTLIEKEAWQAALTDLGRDDLSPVGRRANIVVEGFSLTEAFGRRIRIGDVVIDVITELAPCKLMEDVTPGLMEALKPDCRGGAYGRIVTSGLIAVGARVELLPESSSDDQNQPMSEATGVSR